MLRHQYVQLIAIALGNHPKFWYNNQLVQFPEREVVLINPQADLKSKIREIYQVACSKPPTGNLYNSCDCFFLLSFVTSFYMWYSKVVLDLCYVHLAKLVALVTISWINTMYSILLIKKLLFYHYYCYCHYNYNYNHN